MAEIYCATEDDLRVGKLYPITKHSDGTNSCEIMPSVDFKNETIWVSADQNIWRTLGQSVRFTVLETRPQLVAIEPSVFRIGRESKDIDAF